MPIHYRNTKPTLQTFKALNLIGSVLYLLLIELYYLAGTSTGSVTYFYLSARIGLVKKSSYAMRMPSRSSVL